MQQAKTERGQEDKVKKRYYLGLGSNLGDRINNLSKAVDLLSFLTGKEISSIYATQAVLPVGADPLWDKEFLNLVVTGESTCASDEVFKFCKNIERELGRDFNQPRWSPRLIDIDILLAGELVIDSEEYAIPHKSMLERAFVLIPLCELVPQIRHPISNRLLNEHLQELSLKDINSIKKIELRIGK